MNYILKAILIISFFAGIDASAAQKNKSKVHKPSYVVKNTSKLPKKMPKLKVKQEKIVSLKRSESTVLVAKNNQRNIASHQNISIIQDPGNQIVSVALEN